MHALFRPRTAQAQITWRALLGYPRDALDNFRTLPAPRVKSRGVPTALIFSVVVCLVLLSVLLFSVTRRRCSLTRSLTCRSE